MTETPADTETAGHGIAGKVVAITGAGRGIGAATARHLAARGARVVLGPRAERDLAATADAITASGGTAAYRCTDVTQPGDLRALVDLAVHRFGRLDVLTSIAGVAIPPCRSFVPRGRGTSSPSRTRGARAPGP